MTRWRVIAIGLVLSACEHGETPPPRCGDRVVDFGEQCDDGNDIADDGCDQCVAMNCGNSRIDEFEECDDGNILAGDGCSADCQQEPIPVALSLFWTFQEFATAVVHDCPATFETIELAITGEQTGSQFHVFSCLDGSGFRRLPRDRYVARLTSASRAGVPFARALPFEFDLRFAEASLNIKIFVDVGYLDYAWTLVGAVSGDVLSCAQANVTFVEVSTPSLGLTSRFACELGIGSTGLVPPGSYSFSVAATDASFSPIGTAPPIDGTISLPLGQTTLGVVEIPIPGL